MKKKICLLVAVLSLIGVGAIVVPKWLRWEVEERLNLVRVVSASHDLQPRSIITEDDLQWIEIPSAYVNDAAYVSKEDVIGKITVRNGFIPKGSLFYYSALEEIESVSDAAILNLKPKEVLFALKTDVVALAANALSAGQVVDVYVTLKDDQRESCVGSILKNVRVLGVKDHKGLNLNDPESTKTPHVIQLAVTDEALPVIQKAASLGEISYYATDEAYHQNKECEIDWESDMIKLLGFTNEKAIEG